MSSLQDQELQKPVTRACMFGLIGDRKTDHARCLNRECGCLCHNSTMYRGSWKHEEATGATTTKERT